MNPLLSIAQLPAFDLIKPEHAEPAIRQIIAESEQKIEAFVLNPELSWASVERLEEIKDVLDKATSATHHLFAVMGNDEWRAAHQACLPMISAYRAKLSQHEGLYQFFLDLKNSDEFNHFDQGQKKVVTDNLRKYDLSGVSLPAEQKAEYQAVMQKLTQLQANFGNNVTDATQNFHLHITDSAGLAGVPDAVRTLYKDNANEKGVEGWLVGLDAPQFAPFMDYAENRSLREKLYHAFVTRASDIGPNAGKYDNADIIKNTMRERKKLINLLNFDTYADYSLALKMAEKPSDVVDFLRDLFDRARPIADQKLEALKEYAKSEFGIDELQPWDMAFVSDKLRHKLYEFSTDEVRQYFPMNKVVDGLFEICRTLFGITIKPKSDMSAWHEDVQTYSVFDEQGEEIAYLYMDLYARKFKRGGAWVNNCIERRITQNTQQLPAVFLTCNFTPPTSGEQAYFTHAEITILFHEFGHALHLMLSKIACKSLNSFRLEWDAIELPSQFMENYCMQFDVLTSMSEHKETGEALPRALFDKMVSAKHFSSAFFVLTLAERSLFDMTLHMETFDENSFDVLRTFRKVHEEISPLITPDYNRYPMGFLHIFSGAYSAGYYSYQWADVLCADVFSRFEDAGIFSKAMGDKYKQEILSVGASRPAMESFVAFQGRKPNNDAFLKSYGLID